MDVSEAQNLSNTLDGPCGAELPGVFNVVLGVCAPALSKYLGCEPPLPVAFAVVSPPPPAPPNNVSQDVLFVV
jgi:hypothetical protein